uniref:PRO1094 n=1 Tax=Homo sapiens TaxID=9606 RepID=Q9P1K6_HUMAN|nr:PRO1094 [Homo sapiens]
MLSFFSHFIFFQKWYQLLFMPLVGFSCESIWSWTFLVGRLIIATSISELVIGLFRDSTSSWFSLGRVYVSRNLPISSRFFSLFA